MIITKRFLFIAASLAIFLALSAKFATPAQPEPPPNILFIILDDVGIDQMKIFGYGGLTPPNTPNIDAIAHAGLRFRNTWAMPECSPSRASFFTGRAPLRNQILAPITPIDLANSQLSRYEVAIPTVLKKAQYKSGLFGKYHLGGPEHNPDINSSPHVLGWDFFYGWIEAAPHPIDLSAGGVTDPETAPANCGFIPNTDSGACYFSNGTCTAISTIPAKSTPSRSCLEQGGIFVPNQSCVSPAPGHLNFDELNAYYVSPLVINHENGFIEQVSPRDPRSRIYRTTIETNAARDWIKKQQASNKPWMATLSFSSAHTPYQQPPPNLLSGISVDSSNLDCTAIPAQRVISNQMIESFDTEIGRLLVETNLATRLSDGSLAYHPDATNTMVVIVGDNGTYFPVVKAPFRPLRSKGTVYQAGVWVPLIIAGPLVESPGRQVTHMVNVADLFMLFGEIAGVDVRKQVPRAHILDSVSMLPYLTNPDQESIRANNFTQNGNNIHKTGIILYPCVLEEIDACLTLFPSDEICTLEGGVWYGPGNPDYPDGLTSCCEVNTQTGNDYLVLPDAQSAFRDAAFKVVEKEVQNCPGPGTHTELEFYEVNENHPIPGTDETDLLQGMGPDGVGFLTAEQKDHFDVLRAGLIEQLASEPDCPADGNLDKVVNGQDLANWQKFSSTWGLSSWYDFNFDGLTNDADRVIIEQNLGTRCIPKK